MVTKKQLYSILDNSKEEIEAIIDELAFTVGGKKKLRILLKNADKLNFMLDITSSVDEAISYLLKNSKLRQVKFKTPRIETLYFWRTVNEYELMPILRPNGYYTHLSAMHFHQLLSYESKSLYYNSEQASRSRTGSLEQSRIDNAFRKKQRITTAQTNYGGRQYWLLNGKQTNNYGVISIEIAQDKQIQVTDLERTLIDITVRPGYAGGVRAVLNAYRFAQPRVSILKLSQTLRVLDYVYPYYQSVGFYIEAAGNYNLEAIKEFTNYGSFNYDFYLDYQMIDPAYSKQWRIYYPRDLLI
jgi:hypothetical protein